MYNKLGRSKEAQRLEALIKHHKKAAERARCESQKAIIKLDTRTATMWTECAKNSDRIAREAKQMLDALCKRKTANGFLIKDGGQVFLK